MPESYLYARLAAAAHERMVNAGSEALSSGKPCVPGLDPLWHRELRSRWDASWVNNLSASWRHGWESEAAWAAR